LVERESQQGTLHRLQPIFVSPITRSKVFTLFFFLVGISFFRKEPSGETRVLGKIKSKKMTNTFHLCDVCPEDHDFLEQNAGFFRTCGYFSDSKRTCVFQFEVEEVCEKLARCTKEDKELHSLHVPIGFAVQFDSAVKNTQRNPEGPKVQMKFAKLLVEHAVEAIDVEREVKGFFSCSGAACNKWFTYKVERCGRCYLLRNCVSASLSVEVGRNILFNVF
jgi:hypothetical protein